jgi:hypothetical protein
LWPRNQVGFFARVNGSEIRPVFAYDPPRQPEIGEWPHAHIPAARFGAKITDEEPEVALSLA